MAIFWNFLDSHKLISRKIWVTVKILKFLHFNSRKMIKYVCFFCGFDLLMQFTIKSFSKKLDIFPLNKHLVVISVAESRTVSRETRLRFARQVSRDSRKKSRNKKIGPKMAKFGQKWPIFSPISIENCNFYWLNVFGLQCYPNIQTFVFSLKLCQNL